MTTLEERFQKGIETLTKFRGGTPPASTSGTWREMAPDLYRIVNESLFWHHLAPPCPGSQAEGDVHPVGLDCPGEAYPA